MKEVEDNNVYLALDDYKSDEFILKENLAALIASKNATLEKVTQEVVSIPAALVRLKWQNRREIYTLQVKEEIYGATINAIIEQRPELRDKIMSRLESDWQHLLAREAATLRLTRKLSDGGYQTRNVATVALKENDRYDQLTLLLVWLKPQDRSDSPSYGSKSVYAYRVFNLKGEAQCLNYKTLPRSITPVSILSRNSRRPASRRK